MKTVMFVFTYIIFFMILLINLKLVDHVRLFVSRGYNDALDYVREDGDVN
jgi:hypothetical protein